MLASLDLLEERSNLSQEQKEEIEKMDTFGQKLGQFYKIRPDRGRNEVYPALKSNGESLFERYVDLVDGICNRIPKYPLYHTFLDTLFKTERGKGTNTSFLQEQMRLTFLSEVGKCYGGGYDTYGTLSKTLMGGGNLPLARESIWTLLIALFEMIPKHFFDKDSGLTLNLYWIGGAFGEECLLIALVAKWYSFPIFINTTDVSEEALNIFQSKILEMELGEYIEVEVQNLYTTCSIPTHERTYHVVYTSACIEVIFSLKMLFLALKCESVQYLLCNNDHCQHIWTVNPTDAISDMIKNRKLVVDAKLESDNREDTEDDNDRWIYGLALEAEHRTKDSVQDLLTCLIDNYDQIFISNFGELDTTNTTFSTKPKASAGWNKAGSNLHSEKMNNEWSINIEVFDPPRESENILLNRRRYVPLTIQCQEYKSYAEDYRKLGSTQGAQDAIKTNYWIKCVYPKAKKIWDAQTVTNDLTPDIDTGSIKDAEGFTLLPFPVLTRKNAKHRLRN